MTGIEGDQPITPQMRAQYKQECARGIELFKETLQEYQKSQIPAQKDEYKDVMDKALQVIRETVPQCLSAYMQKEEKELEHDYDAFIHNPSPQNYNKLAEDIKHFERQL